MLEASYRIPKEEIPNIVRKGKKYQSEMFDVKAWFDDKLEHPHFAVVISAKVDKRAVVRNTIRRKFKAAIYNILQEDPTFFRMGNYVIIVRSPELENLKSEQIEDLIEETLS